MTFLLELIFPVSHEHHRKTRAVKDDSDMGPTIKARGGIRVNLVEPLLLGKCRVLMAEEKHKKVDITITGRWELGAILTLLGSRF